MLIWCIIIRTNTKFCQEGVMNMAEKLFTTIIISDHPIDKQPEQKENKVESKPTDLLKDLADEMGEGPGWYTPR